MGLATTDSLFALALAASSQPLLWPDYCSLYEFIGQEVRPFLHWLFFLHKTCWSSFHFVIPQTNLHPAVRLTLELRDLRDLRLEETLFQ